MSAAPSESTIRLMTPQSFPQRACQLSSLDGHAQLGTSDRWAPWSVLERKNKSPALLWTDPSYFDDSGMFAGTSEVDLARSAEAPWFLTEVNVLPSYRMDFPGVSLNGVICHMSRCGSTLASNMLEAMEGYS